MNSRDLVSSALRGEKTPRRPCGPLAVHFCAADAGVTIRDFSLDPEVHAECILRYYERYRPDAVWISADTWITAEAMGAPVVFLRDDIPPSGPGDGFITAIPELDRIPAPDPSRQGRQPLIREALSRVVERLGGEVFVVGCFDQSPFSLACQAVGLSRMMRLLSQDPAFVEALLEKCLEYVQAYAFSLAECGADMLSTGDSPAGLIGPRHYERTALPAEKRLFRALREKTDAFLSLHICGDTRLIVDRMAACGADVLEIDSAVPLSDAAALTKGRVALWGNIDPVGILLNGGKKDVTEAVRNLLQEAETAGLQKFVLSSGCTLAPETPRDNLRTFLEGSRWPL